MTKMNDVNAHICPTCGGKLFVDKKRQMYECPFCGVTFDYDYFREESVLDIAAQALKSNEFDSANRAYDFMLEKDPDNFEALRGKALIAMDITKIDDISSLDLFSKLKYKPVYDEIDRGIESSKPQDREYFTVMKDIVDSGREYIDEKAQLENQKAERERTIDRLSEIARERDTICIYSSPKYSKKKAVILTIICYVLCCLLIFLGYKYVNRNPYAQAEDLSRYETTQTSDSQNRTNYPYSSSFNLNDFSNWYTNHQKYEEALKREELRKINYEAWEENHKNSNNNLIYILVFATVIYALFVFVLFMCGRTLDAEISKIKAKMNEQNDKIKKREETITELKDRINQDYKRLCELHPVNDSDA